MSDDRLGTPSLAYLITIDGSQACSSVSADAPWPLAASALRELGDEPEVPREKPNAPRNEREAAIAPRHDHHRHQPGGGDSVPR